jgi:hypothetical protein
LDRQHSEFFLSDLQKLEQLTKKCIELRGEYVEWIPSLIAVACFLPGRAKDLSTPPRTSGKHRLVSLLAWKNNRGFSHRCFT